MAFIFYTEIIFTSNRQDKCLMLAFEVKRHPDTDGSSQISFIRRLFTGG